MAGQAWVLYEVYLAHATGAQQSMTVYPANVLPADSVMREWYLDGKTSAGFEPDPMVDAEKWSLRLLQESSV